MSVNVHPFSEVDEGLRARFLAATETPRDADWRDVERRARELVPARTSKLPRSRVVLVAVVVAAFAAAAPALGVDRAIVGFFASEPASEIVKLDARHWFEEVKPEGRRPGIVTDEMRKVHAFATVSGSQALLMAPAHDGYCWSLADHAGACEDETSRVIEPLWRDIPPASASSPEPPMIAGPINALNAERLVVTFQDGAQAEVPFVLVSEPIGAGFFYYEVPRERWQPGSRPTRLSVYGPDDAVLGTAAVAYEGDG
jgi:hypothetical protein